MTKSQLIAAISKQTHLSQTQVDDCMDAMVSIICDRLKNGEKVTIAGMGRFEMRERKTKAYTNPKTKLKSQLDPTSIPGFKVSGLMKQRIQKN